MKKVITTLAIAAIFAGALLSGCQSPSQKEEVAEDKVENAEQDLKEAQLDANEASQKAAHAEEWQAFKNESEIKIKDNETRITGFRMKMKKSGKTLDGIYSIRIDTLEQKNNDLKSKMDSYEKSHSDWESFKREFNHDMDELGQALKDFAVNNKN